MKVAIDLMVFSWYHNRQNANAMLIVPFSWTPHVQKCPLAPLIHHHTLIPPHLEAPWVPVLHETGLHRQCSSI